MRGCTHPHRRLQASRAWDPLPDRYTGRAVPSGAWRAVLSKAGCERPQALRGRSVAQVLAKGPPHGEPRVRPGDAPQVLPRPRSARGAAAAPGHGGGQAAGRPRVPSRPPTHRTHSAHRAATSRGGRRRGACALVRSRPGPWALQGGREVGRWAGAGQHTLPAQSLRRCHLAARAPRNSRRMSGAGKRVVAARDPVGGVVPAPARGPPEATGPQS